MKHLSRREALRGTGVAALAVGAAVVPLNFAQAAAEVDADAELRNLWAEYLAIVAAIKVGRRANDKVRKPYDREFDARKADYEHRGGFGESHRELWSKYDVEKTWAPLCRLLDERARVAKAIHAAEATTLFGIGVKLSVNAYGDEDDVIDSAENARAAIAKLIGYDFANQCSKLYRAGDES